MEYTNSNLSFNTTHKTQHFSSNSLQGYNNLQVPRASAPRYHNYSSQAVNLHPQLEVVNQETRCLYFDFGINEEFKITKVPLSYFVDPDTNELVYYKPIAEQLILYNYNCYVKATLYFPPVDPRSIQLIEKVYFGYINLFDIRE